MNLGCKYFFFLKYYCLVFLWKFDRRGEDCGKDNVCVLFFVYLCFLWFLWMFMIFYDFGEKECFLVYS